MFPKYEPGFCNCAALPPDADCTYCVQWVAEMKVAMAEALAALD